MKLSKIISKRTIIITSIIIVLLIALLIIWVSISSKKVNSNKEKSDITDILFTDNVINLKPNETYQLSYTVAPINYIEEKIKYYVNDDSVLSVNDEGLIKGLKSGAAVVTLITETGKTADVEVIVEQNEVSVIEPIPVLKKVEVKESTINLQSGQKYQVKYDVSPSNAVDQTLMWETSDQRIATVTDSGLITARRAGTTIINIYYNDSIKASISVTVSEPQVNLTDIELRPSEIYLELGDSYQITTQYFPSNASNKNLIWKSSNTNIVSVTNSGLITALNKGSATITASSADISKSIVVSVEEKSSIVEITSLKLKNTSSSISVGETLQLSVIYSPLTATNKSFIWSSSNSDVASISNSGLIKGLKAGKTVITVKSTNNKSTSMSLIVNEKESNQVEQTELLLNVDSISITVGQTKQLRATILPLTANQSVTWYSGDTNVAEVNENGLVTAKKAGKTTISALSSYGTVAKLKFDSSFIPVSPATAATKYSTGDNISSDLVDLINTHLAYYIEEAGSSSSLNPLRAKVLAAAYFLIYNPYYKVAYMLGGESSVKRGWDVTWGNSTSSPIYLSKGMDCGAFVRWTFFQVFGEKVNLWTSSGPLRATSETGLTVREIAAVAEPGDVLIKSKALNNSQYGHVAIVYSVNRDEGTFVVAHASGAKTGITMTEYNRRSSETNYNYVLSMAKVYQEK